MRASARAEVELIATKVAHEAIGRRVRSLVDDTVRLAVRKHLDQESHAAVERGERSRNAAVDRSLATVREKVERSLEQHAEQLRRIASDAAMNALLDVTPTMTALVREEVGKAFAQVTPPVVNVHLPSGRTVRLDADAHERLPELLLALHARCHVLLVGPAGTGKSMLARNAADALGLPFRALSLGPTTPMSKVFGYFDAHGEYHATPFREAFEHGGVMLLDELDNGHPGLLGELNQALALRACAFADGMVEAHEDFLLVATANTYGRGGDHRYVGRQALDAATLDRFTVIDVPVDPVLEHRLALGSAPSKQDEARELLAEVRRLRGVAERENLPLTFSPRASIDGARLLEAGASLAQALRWRVTRGLTEAHRKALGLTGPRA